MKFVRFGERHKEKPGVLDNQQNIRDLSSIVPDISGDLLTNLASLKNINLSKLPIVGGSPRLGACVAGTKKFICIGMNYHDHGKKNSEDEPKEPLIFQKATSAICGPNDPIIIPRGSIKTDWEAELGVIIGKPAKYVDHSNALDHVAGYCVINDVSERAFQNDMGGQWTKGKSCDNFGQTGPWLVTPDEIPDPQKLGLWLEVNGERVQDGSTANMICDVAFLISYLSKFFTLETGDIISTGTPFGVGASFKPQRFLKTGDVVRLGLDGLGEQRQIVIDDI